MYSAETHFKNLYDTVPRAYEFHATTREELVAWQANFRPKLREILGLDNMASDLADYVPKRNNWKSWIWTTISERVGICG